MVLLLASFHEFTLFLRIVLWIAVPLIVVSLAVTTILHYRQKKKNAVLGEEHPALPAAEEIDISLVSRLQKEVNHYKKRIRELQHALSFEKGRAVTDVKLTDKLAEAPKPTDLAVDPALIESALPDNHTDLAYLNDLIEEQKTHVQFLQQQLESRIKSFHELESRFRDQSENLARMTAAFEHNKHQLDDLEATELKLKNENTLQAEKLSKLEASLKELQLQHNQSLKMLDAGLVSESMPHIPVLHEVDLHVK